MNLNSLRHSRHRWPVRTLAVVATAFALIGGVLTIAQPASAASAATIGNLALANIGKGAGSCSITPSTNSLGGSSFGSSCAGGGQLWCADFVQWVWANAGVNTTGITPASQSFVTAAGRNGSTVHTSSAYAPQVGDAIVYSNGAHVGVVAAVASNGTITTADGDFNGQGSDVHFAQTSKVMRVTTIASQARVGATPANIGMRVTAIVTPGGVTGGAPVAAPPAPAPAVPSTFGAAFEANTTSLWNVLNGSVGSPALGMMHGTSPSIAKLSTGGYEIAFQANTGSLWTTGSAGTRSWGLGMMAGTSPAISALPGGQYEVAFQANTGSLWTVGASNHGAWNLGMMHGTNPAITNLANGSYEVAFQANTTSLWTVGSDPHGAWNLGMATGSSPAITAAGSGYEVAFQANTTNLWTVGASTNRDWGLGMYAGSSPAIAG